SKDASESVKKAFDSTVEAVKQVRDEIKSAYDEMNKAVSDFQKRLTGESDSFEGNAAALVAKAREEITNLEKQLREANRGEDKKDIESLKAKLAEQKEIVKSYEKSGLDLE